MQQLEEKSVPLFSFHSVSKGFMGECGHRGGYLELRNIPDDVLAEFVKDNPAVAAELLEQLRTRGVPGRHADLQTAAHDANPDHPGASAKRSPL